VVVDHPGHQDFIRLELRHQRLQPPRHTGARPDRGTGQRLLHLGPHPIGHFGQVLHRRRQPAGPPHPQPREGEDLGRPQERRLGIAFRRAKAHPDHRMRPRQPCRRLKTAAIDMQRLGQGLRREMRRKGIGQPQPGRQLRAIEA